MAYTKHIKRFIDCTHGATNLTQDDVDRYFNKIRKQDEQRQDGKLESGSTKKHRVSALKLYLNDCLRLNIEFKDYSIKSNT